MTDRGAGWGARREVVHRATSALRQLVEAEIGAPGRTTALNITLSFDPSNLAIQSRARREGEARVLSLHFDH